MSAKEIIQQRRKQLTEIIQKDLARVLDDLLSRSVITEEEYEDLDKMEEDATATKKSEKLLLLVQNKGESACCQFLEWVEIAYPGSKQALQSSGQDQKALQMGELQSESSPGGSSQEQEDEVWQGPAQEGRHPARERSEAVEDILCKLKLNEHKSKKLSLQQVLEISSESLKESTPQTLEDLPWHFLKKVLALDVTARNTTLGKRTPDEPEMRGEEGEMSEENLFSQMASRVSLNPLDVLCAVLMCSDSSLQQWIFSKMSMCQFALPLLLPPLETPKCTLMLWAMRDIVKRWRPHSLAESRGFREESLVMTSMPTISFVRMGSCSLSKSKLLNELLSHSQQHHDFFIHRDMKCGNVPHEIADGMIEMAWYFPGGQGGLDLFPEPVAIANLRGDVESHWVQFSFLTQVSSAVFILAECINEREFALLSSLKESSTEYYFILDHQSRKFNETLDFLNQLAPVLDLKNSQVLVKAAKTNKADFVENLQSTVGRIIKSHPKSMNLEEMSAVAQGLTIQVDEDCREYWNAFRCAGEVIEKVKNTAAYKKGALILQGDIQKKLADVEKELCRMERQGDIPSEHYRWELKGKWMALKKQQNRCKLYIDSEKFISGIKNLKLVERHYFFKLIKLNSDHIVRESLSMLRAEYKEKCKAGGDDGQETAAALDMLSPSTFGIEHLMRTLGEYYQAEYSKVAEGKLEKNKCRLVNFPSIAADLMLEGFPLELIGDASNVPVQWITDVLMELHRKLGGRSKVVVITVLGVQGTGKSTLLNTMFGLQFAVSSGRCTRGAFMTLLNVRENMTQELGCDHILVIDTEGLKVPELAQLDYSYRHNNELATLVIGLSDITIVNMTMENATEMKDVLQIVTHAFLRMQRIGQKPNCQFVHQNVSDVSAHDQNMRDREHLLEQLNEMTQAAAKMENVGSEIKFSDVMDYDSEMHNWYIPGLWHGVLPMAEVNRGYSEKVFEFKKYLFECIRNRLNRKSPKDIPQFIEWVRKLWDAVKHENFIFSFQNSLIAQAYMKLSTKYFEWDSDFRKEMHVWVSEQETAIQNVSNEELDHSRWRCELQDKLCAGEQRILEFLEHYFESCTANVHLVEKYREDFVKNANTLRCELESSSYNKLWASIQLKKRWHKIDSIQVGFLKIIEGKFDWLLEECKKRSHRLDNQKLKFEFEQMWAKMLSEISPIRLEKREIYADVETKLRKDLFSRGRLIIPKLLGGKGFLSFRINNFQMKKDYLQSSWWRQVTLIPPEKEHLSNVEELSKSLMAKCMSYIDSKFSFKGDYEETYCVELLHMINERLQPHDVLKLCTTPGFEVDLKLHILGEAAHAFQKMHENFIEENDPQVLLEKRKPQYFSVFRDLYLEKDAQQIIARDFCDWCLHPALVDYMNKRLGTEIVDNILKRAQSIAYSSQSFFQFTVLKDLLEARNFDQYVKYITAYEEFVKSWIGKQILNHYTEKEDLQNLEEKILSAILEEIGATLVKLKHQDTGTVSEFLNLFCKEMQKKLVISTDNLVRIQFKDMPDPGQVSVCVETLLPDLKKEILSAFDSLDLESKLSQLPVKLQDEIFKREFGCGQQCPFCKVPCEAGGSAHKEHFAAVHRPQGLGGYKHPETKNLFYGLCSSYVASKMSFESVDTKWKRHPYMDYHAYYSDWSIQPDPSTNASDYWKFIFKEFNHDFAKHYHAKPADLPEDWKMITREHALKALKEIYNMD
ncbi:up-regulator of cell proliferation-like [Hemicordylus capensis]|uniref:up-regulator of cell proliferation-like n=1 Tax=Hemicordylus capensis TaxID=884348 RepID=UPI002302A168|nr:up-regulator of cell proliferation-like [Hemicordylus capensis]